MVLCLERDADLHMAQLMPLPLTVSCFSKIQIGFTFLVPADPGSPGLMRFKVMPFGMVNSGSTYNRMVRKLLEEAQDIESYVDDVLGHTTDLTYTDVERLL